MESLEFGPLVLQLPSASSAEFRLKHDLAGLFGLETNGDALDRLQRALGKNATLTVDHESDFVFVASADPGAMVAAVRVILSLAKDPLASAQDYDALSKALGSWKRPERQSWEAGSVFAVPLKDGSYGFGRVYSAAQPTVLLYAQRDPGPTPPLTSAQGICLARTTPDLLDRGTWCVLPREKTGWMSRLLLGARAALARDLIQGSGILQDFLNAYHGLDPWNVKHDPKYYDGMLRLGVGRPKAAKLLNDQERDEYRRQQGWDK